MAGTCSSAVRKAASEMLASSTVFPDFDICMSFVNYLELQYLIADGSFQ
jgi:hypothetical protein